jgi:hypothetical protein
MFLCYRLYVRNSLLIAQSIFEDLKCNLQTKLNMTIINEVGIFSTGVF